MKPVPASDFARPPVCAGRIAAGLPATIDTVAQGAGDSHRFLRAGWYAAAVETYGGAPRTLVVEQGGAAALTLPMVALGPRVLGFAQVPGCYWPFRGFPVVQGASDGVFAAAVEELARRVRCLRIGPAYDGDASVMPLVEAARAAGWTVTSRFIADSYLLDIAELRAEGVWPRTSTLKKNRFHEKHLAEHGALDWSFVTGADWTGGAFDDLAAVERNSWIASATDGSDAKFTPGGHGAFWRAAARDPVLADMLWAAVLQIDGRPAAFSFDVNAGALKYAVANSYDTRFAKQSPGKLLYYRNLVRAIDDGMTRVDWGAGDSGYKQTIGAAPGPTIRDWLFFAPGVSATLGRALAPLWRRSGNR